MKKHGHQKFEGFRFPTTTPIPDELFDELMAELSGAELKVLLYICRRTFGFKKESDNISLNQMLRGITKKDGTPLDGGVGLSKPTLLRTIRGLVKKQIILAEQRVSKRKGNEPTNYRLHMFDPLGKKMNQGEGQNFTKPLVKKRDPQQTVGQQTARQHTVTNGRKKNLIFGLDTLEQPKEKTAYVAQYVLDELGDKQSLQFYKLVAAKVPEGVIRKTLSEIKTDGAHHPARVFTYRMNLYALQQQKKKLLHKF